MPDVRRHHAVEARRIDRTDPRQPEADKAAGDGVDLPRLLNTSKKSMKKEARPA